MRKNVVSSLLCLATPLLVGCGAEYAPYTPEDAPSALGSAQAAVAACEGDDLQYDFNAFAASLAVAIANEMGRWDVLTDFDLNGDTLALSPTGRMLCGNDCSNVEAILALQSDASAEVPYHSPALFRDKLSSWYKSQETLLVESATVQSQGSGIVRFISQYSNRAISASDGWDSSVRLYRSTSSVGADEWEMRVSGDKHSLVNVRSGKCMDLQWDSSNAPVVQATCNDSNTQRFEIDTSSDGQSVLIETKHGKALEVQHWSNTDGAKVSQGNRTFYETNKLWRVEHLTQSQNASSGASDGIPNGMFSLMSQLTGKAFGVEGSSSAAGAPITARNYRAGSDNMEWFVSKVGSKFQLINRHSRLCLATAPTGTWEDKLSQEECANAPEQLFEFPLAPHNTGQKYFGIRAHNGKYVNVRNWSTADGAQLVASGSGYGGENTLFRLEEILAGEPHELSFSHITNDGPCGDYYWYEVSQPNGLPLAAPEETFEQLVFAGGKMTLDGSDDNPFIAQQTNGTLVAIDPSSYMNTTTLSSSGSCVASDILYDRTRKAAGKCCVRYNGKYGSFAQSSWSSTTFLCR